MRDFCCELGHPACVVSTWLATHTPSLQVPVVQVHVALHVSVRVPHIVPHGWLGLLSPGAHTPVSLPHVLQSDHVPVELHTRTCVPHLPHARESLAPGVHAGDVHAPKSLHAHALEQVRVF